MNLHRHAARLTCPELFISSSGIFADNILRRFQYSGRASVILLELNDGRAREIPLKIKNICEISPSPAINRLPIITYDADIPVFTDKAFDNSILRRVGVLIFVN